MQMLEIVQETRFVGENSLKQGLTRLETCGIDTHQ